MTPKKDDAHRMRQIDWKGLFDELMAVDAVCAAIEPQENKDA